MIPSTVSLGDSLTDLLPTLMLTSGHFSSYQEKLCLAQQVAKLDIFLNQIIKASSLKRSLLVMGDCNLDQDRWDTSNYVHLKLANQLRTSLAQAGLEIIPMGMITICMVRFNGHFLYIAFQ
jgi:hypothetical protein